MMSTRVNTGNEYIHVKSIFTLTHTQAFLFIVQPQIAVPC